MAVQFSNDGCDVIKRQVTAKPTGATWQNVAEYYEINRSVTWILSNEFKVVALQFPDNLLNDSASVTKELSRKTEGVQFFVLGDSTYGSCCVDEIAAQHVNADCIIHYGRACLSPTGGVPVLYVFGRERVDVEDCCSKFRSLFTDVASRVFILGDVMYDHLLDDVRSRLSSEYENLTVAKLQHTSSSSVDASCESAVRKCGRTFSIPVSSTVEAFDMFYVGSPDSLAMLNLMLTFNKCKFSTYDPDTREGRREVLNINRMLMRRYYMIEKAKDAQLVGILVGTLGVMNYIGVIDQLKSVIRQAGKKYYTISVGKLNPAKLANFLEIDVFVLVACSENSLIDSQEFYRPIVTPFEMEIACNRQRTWTGDYVTDFQQLLPGAAEFVPLNPEENTEVSDVSLVTGRIRSIGVRVETEQDTYHQYALVEKKRTMLTALLPSADKFLNERGWSGLKENLGDTPVQKAKEGQKGIAMEYSTEPVS